MPSPRTWFLMVPLTPSNSTLDGPPTLPSKTTLVVHDWVVLRVQNEQVGHQCFVVRVGGAAISCVWVYGARESHQLFLDAEWVKGSSVLLDPEWEGTPSVMFVSKVRRSRCHQLFLDTEWVVGASVLQLCLSPGFLGGLSVVLKSRMGGITIICFCVQSEWEGRQ